MGPFRHLGPIDWLLLSSEAWLRKTGACVQNKGDVRPVLFGPVPLWGLWVMPKSTVVQLRSTVKALSLACFFSYELKFGLI